MMRSSSGRRGRRDVRGDAEFGGIDRRQDDQQRQQGQRHEAVGDAHQQGIGRSAEVARGEADRRADHRRGDRRREPDQQRRPAACEQPQEDVAPQFVRSERMMRRTPERNG